MTRRLILGVTWLALVTACGSSSPPTSPTATSPAAEPSLQTVTIGGPTLLPTGESRQFSATASFSDKSTRDVTGTAVWRTSSASVYSVTTSGLVTATTAGEGSIILNYQNRGASLHVVSLPAGTGILSGTVKEASFPVAGATIEAVSGSFVGRSTVSDSGGFYRLYGVVGDLQIRARKDGYVFLTKQVTVAPFATPRRDQSLDFDLNSTTQPLTLAGSYRVSIRASSTCSAKLPADAAVRNYTATITQDGSRVTVVLSGAEFAVNSSGVPANRITGRARADSVEFSLGGNVDYYYYYYSSWAVVERLSRPPTGAWGFAQTSYFAVGGTAAGPATSSTISATLNGSLAIYEAPGSFYGQRRPASSCIARDHALVLTRQ